MSRKFAFLVLLWLVEVAVVYGPKTATKNYNDQECRLSDVLVRTIFDDADATWTIDDGFLSVHQLQDVLDCTENEQNVALNVSESVVPQRTLVIRKRITIQPSQALDTNVKATLTCPSNDTLIFIENASVVLENIVIKECSFNQHLSFMSILKVKCDEKRNEAFVLSLMNVEFLNNRNVGGSTGITIENPECVSVIMKNVAFWNNDLPLGSKLTHKNDFYKIFALWHPHESSLEIDPLLDLKDRDGAIIVASPLLEVGEYSLVLRVSEMNVDDISLNMAARQCLIDEFLEKNTKRCVKCEVDHYNFHPMRETCKICPKNADCSGEYVLPLSGYWNSFPCSTHVQECRNNDACLGLKPSIVKETIMMNITRTCDLSSVEIEKYRDAQCDKGYQNVLCGSCEKDYGRIELYECIPCQNKVLIVIAMLVTSCMLVYSSWEQIAANLEFLNTRWMQRLERPSWEEREEDAQQELQIVESSEECINVAQKAKQKFVLVMQIAQNFLQSIGACVSINCAWSKVLPRLLTASNSLGLNMSQVYKFSFECLLPIHKGTPRSVLSTMLALFVPFMIIGTFCTYWLYDTFKMKKPWKHLVKRCILSFVSVFNVCYYSLAKTASSSYFCFKVFDAISRDGQGVSQEYWVADTSVRCWEGSHDVLRYWAAIPLLIFVYLSLFVLCVVLIVALERDAIQSEWIRETLGVLFIGFKPDYEIWLFLILLRKVTIANYAVISYSGGDIWQGVAVTLVFALCMVLHLIICPYRTDFGNLNFLEGFSLFVCGLTALISTILAKQHVSSEIMKDALLAIMFTFNAVSIIVFGYQLLTNKFIEIKYTLMSEGIVHETDSTYVVLLKSLHEKLKDIRKFLRKIESKLCPNFNRNRSEIGSGPS